MRFNYNNEDKILYINKIYNAIQDCHNESNQDNWYEKFYVDVNYSMYKHGLIKNHGNKDYIINDFIKDNMYLTKQRKSYRLLKDNSILSIMKRKDIQDNFSNNYGDFVIDFIDLNYIAYKNKNFANKLVEKLDLNFKNLKFSKLFALYTAKYLLDIIIEKEKKYNAVKDEYEDFINFVFDSYDDFTINIPTWIE